MVTRPEIAAGRVIIRLEAGASPDRFVSVARAGYSPMILPSNQVRIMVATEPINFRKGHDGLSASAPAALREDPFASAHAATSRP